MRAAEEQPLTVGEAARRLDMSIESVLDAVYSGQLLARTDSASGRMLIRVEDLQAMRADHIRRHDR